MVDHIDYTGGGVTDESNCEWGGVRGVMNATRIQKALWLCRGLWRTILTCCNFLDGEDGRFYGKPPFRFQLNNHIKAHP